MTGGHLDECPDLMVSCPNKGREDGIKRKQMACHHLECPYEIIGCPYKDVGWAYTSPRGTMDDHKATSCGCHLDLAMVLLRNLDLKAASCKDDLVQAKVQLDHKTTKDDLIVAVVKLEQYCAQTHCSAVKDQVLIFTYWY